MGMCKFLLVFYCKYDCISYRFGCLASNNAMPWYLSKGSLKIIKMANSIVQTMSKIASFIPRQHLTTPLGWSLLPIGWSECPSVCLSRSGIMSKRINMSSKFFHHRVATPTILVIFIPNGVAIFLREPPPNGYVECRWGYRRTSLPVDGDRRLWLKSRRVHVKDRLQVAIKAGKT